MFWMEWFFIVVHVLFIQINILALWGGREHILILLLLFRWGIYRSFHWPNKNWSRRAVSSRHFYHNLLKRRRNSCHFSIKHRGTAFRRATRFSWTRTLTWTWVHSTDWTRTYISRDKFRIAQWSCQTVHRISGGTCLKWEFMYH